MSGSGLFRARALAVLLSVLGAKAVLLITSGRFAGLEGWQLPFAFSHDVLTVLAVLLCFRASRGHGAGYLLAALVVFCNALLTVVAIQVRAYYSPADPMPDFTVQWRQVLQDYLDPPSIGLILSVAVVLTLLPKRVQMRLTPSPNARPSPRARHLLVALTVYGVLGLVVLLPPRLSAFQIHRNPIVFYASELLAPTQLVDRKTPPASLSELTATLQAASPILPFLPVLSKADIKAMPPSNVLFVLMESVGHSAVEPSFLEGLAPKMLVFDAHHSPAPHSASALEILHCGAFRPPRLQNGELLERCRPFPARLAAAGLKTAFFQSSFFGDWIAEPFFHALGYGETYDSKAIAAQAEARGAPISLVRDVALERDTTDAVLRWASERCQNGEHFMATYYTWIAHAPYPEAHAQGQPFDPSESPRARHRQLISVLDHEVSRLYTTLASMPCGGRPLTLVVTGDHGEAFLEHKGNFYHTAYAYQENLHVPLMVLSSFQHGGRTSLPTSHVDLARTLTDLALGRASADVVAGQGPPLGGRSLLDATEVEPVFAYSLLGDGMLAARFGRHKLIKSRDVRVLFDLESDAAEQLDLSERDPAMTQRLSDATDRYFAWARANVSRAP